jgi:hypothetical protein
MAKRWKRNKETESKGDSSTTSKLLLYLDCKTSRSRCGSVYRDFGRRKLMSSYKKLQDLLRSLRLVETSQQLPVLLQRAQDQDLSYAQFLLEVMTYEQKQFNQLADLAWLDQLFNILLLGPTGLSRAPVEQTLVI